MKRTAPPPDLAAQIVAPPRRKTVSGMSLLSTGSTLLNLALADTRAGGYASGKIVNVIGDSQSGKTFLALTMCAEAARSPVFQKHRLIFDDAEASNEFDMVGLFGEATARRVEPPAKDAHGDLPSDTVQAFYDNVDRALDADKPFIYILDSYDSISSEEEEEAVAAAQKARREGKEVKGTYGTAKAKASSWILRMLKRRLRTTNSLLIIISQTRENLNPASFQKKYRSGGKALDFYADQIFWTASKGRLKGHRDRVMGVQCIARVTKSKLTGKLRDVEFPIFYSYGIDDIGSCVDYLVAEEHWPTKAEMINATRTFGPGFIGNRARLIDAVEQGNREADLSAAVEEVWRDIEEKARLVRKPRYT